MEANRGIQVRWTIPVLIAVCLAALPDRADSLAAADLSGTAQTGRYLFLSDQTTLLQTGGIAGVHWTYAVQGQFVLTIDPGAGTASFTQVDANAVDDSPYRRTLDPNEVFAMTSLVGTVLSDTSLEFTGKAADGSDVHIAATLQEDRVHLVAQTVPPPDSADFFVFNMDAFAQRRYGGGTGGPHDPYQIATAADLIVLGETSEDYDKHFILTKDIDLDPNLPGGKVFDRAVIGAAGTSAFTGVFDGDGHTISHLTVQGKDCLGLFGQLGVWWPSVGEVKDLGVMDVNVVGSGSQVGGLVGYNEGTVTQCYSAGTVSGDWSVGGLVGLNGYRDDDFDGSGIQPGTVHDSYSTASVSGTGAVGGLVGETSYGTVTSCYSIGAVNGTWAVGGLVGRNDVWSEAVTGCFWDAQTSGQVTSAGGTGKTTAEMQTAQTFLDAGWDFVGETVNGTDDIWWINEGKGYPRLSWEGPAGMVFVDIPAGTFEMGDHGTVGREDQRPVHTVTLDGFQMSRHEITNAQYAQYLNAAMADGLIQVVNGVVCASSEDGPAQEYCDTSASSAYSQIEYTQGRFRVRSRDGKAMSDHPVVRVNWYGARAFCDYYGWRLPTEAEWEYAARGGYHAPYCQYPWGSNAIDCTKANCKDGSSYCNPLALTSHPYTSPVGTYGPQGAYGLCDMSGNLWEWCQDWYDPTYYSVSPAANPAGPTQGTTRVLRGGAWDVQGSSCNVADRAVAGPDVRGQVVGIRVCR